MITKRRITLAQVRGTRRLDRISISVPGDFRVASVEVIDSPGAGYGPLLPYCIDFPRGRSIYVGGVDTKAAQAAPFYYLYLRRHARTVVSVPWERGRLCDGAARVPLFLFSPGRCGSTLLSRILSAAGA